MTMATTLLQTKWARCLVRPTYRHQIVSLICQRKPGANFPDISYQHRISKLSTSRFYANGTFKGTLRQPAQIVEEATERGRNGPNEKFTEKVLTDNNVDVHQRICAQIFGRKGDNLQKLKCGMSLSFHIESKNVGYMLISSSDAEHAKMAATHITLNVQRIKNEMLHVTQKIPTDIDPDVHERLCGMVIGIGGNKIKRMKKETRLNFQIRPMKGTGENSLYVIGRDTEEVKKAAQIISQEIQRVKVIRPPNKDRKNGLYSNGQTEKFTEKVLTDDDAETHDRLCAQIIGRKGINIQNLQSSLSLNFRVNTKHLGYVLVSSSNAEHVRMAASYIRGDIHRLKNHITQKIPTDSDPNVHRRLCSMLFGIGGNYIKKLKEETGLNFQLRSSKGMGENSLEVIGDDTEEVKKAAEIICQEVEKAKSLATEKVLTDPDADIHDLICALIIGKAGENIERLRSDLGEYFHVDTSTDGHIHITGKNAELLKKAAEEIIVQVKRIKKELDPLDDIVSENVSTDQDEVYHHRIC